MKLTGISVQNFLGARAVEVQLTKPITLFAGANGAGKSSLQEAIRMALTGEAVRVNLKKDYAKLITTDADTGFAEVEIDGGARAFVTLPDGKTTHITEYVPPTSLPYVLGAQSFATLDANTRRAFLFGLMGLSVSGAEVKKRLLAKGCNDQKVEYVMPMLRSGFDAAEKDARSRATEAKGAWRAITGETYGSQKAEGWKRAKIEAVSDEEINAARNVVETAKAAISALDQEYGAAKATREAAAGRASRVAALQEKAKRYARIAEKLNRDEAELKEWEAKVATIKDADLSQNALPCPTCATMLVLKGGALVHASPLAKGSTDDDIARLAEYEKAMNLLQSAVANDKRDLTEADTAAKQLEALRGDSAEPLSDHAFEKLQDRLNVEKDLLRTMSSDLAKLEEQNRSVAVAGEVTAKAAAHHADVMAWLAVADALAPDGIPGEMQAEALEPINDRLEQSSQDAEWLHVHIGDDMAIEAAYPKQPPRPYALLSESEKWRADAMLAEAIANLSKIKVLVLDRFDVLDLKGRGDLIAWLDILAKNGEINTAMIFGTLKAAPVGLPTTVAAHWLENGVLTQLREAA
ncbi:MAG: AAA family ATPase [Burkholderiales bacterium]|nr:AAA family ATPase [Burkholderiales bacterium]